MFGQITNRKEEKLYILIATSTNDIKPYIEVDTWENCIGILKCMIKEKHTDRVFIQLIHKEVNEEMHRAEASIRCNRKGYGSDFFRYITIEPLYTDAW